MSSNQRAIKRDLTCAAEDIVTGSRRSLFCTDIVPEREDLRLKAAAAHIRTEALVDEKKEDAVLFICHCAHPPSQYPGSGVWCGRIMSCT